ncbi:MAG: DUF4012 domain-containing protein [bacterium]|nr:DUF4012 domain-containing protein [bacterium]
MKHEVVTERVQNDRPPLFIVDQEGFFLDHFASELSAEFLPIILTKKSIPPKTYPHAVIINQGSRYPKIPDNSFQGVYVFVGSETPHSDFFSALLREVKNREIPFYFISPLRLIKRKFLTLVTSYSLGQVFLYGDIIDKNFWNTPARALVDQANENESLLLKNQGLSSLYPATSEFIAATIIRLSIVEKLKIAVTAILPEGLEYEISFARLLQQVNPLLRVDYLKAKERRGQTVQIPEGTAVVLQPRESLKEWLREHGMRKDHKREPLKKRRRRFIFSFDAIFLSLLVPAIIVLTYVLITLGASLVGQRLLVRAVREATTLHLQDAAVSAKSSRALFSLGTAMANGILSPLRNTPFRSLAEEIVEKSSFGETVAGLLGSSVSAGETYLSMVSGERRVSKDEFSGATQDVKNNLLLLSLLQEDSRLPEEYKETVASYKKTTGLFLATADILPNILGFDRERKYLLLFQNNNELRPGGGFIGSYAVVSVKDGRVGPLKVHDVYDADGQLKGHVEPPEALRKYLGVTHWYLRDSNFSPDFPSSAGTAAFFLQLETGEKVDGVIAIDTSFLKGMVHALGPLRLPNSAIVVNDENVTSFLQDTIQKEFFPGSSLKKDLLSELIGGFFLRLQAPDGKVIGDVLQTIESGITQKHLLFAFVNKAEEQPFLVMGASSSLDAPSQEDKDGVQDFFGVNEANVGTNKVNEFIKRSFQYALSVDESGALHMQVTQTIENASTGAVPYGGDYKAYLRFILPGGVSPQEIAVDGVKQIILAPLEGERAYVSRGAVAENALEVDRVDEKGKSIYGFYLHVAGGTKKKISLIYALPMPAKKVYGRYHLSLFKQPGTGADPFIFSLELPQGYQLLSSKPPMTEENGRHVFLSQLVSDEDVSIVYGKK